jgi:hypothetical protein
VQPLGKMADRTLPKTKDLQPYFLLQQFCAYKNEDPKEKQQKAIPICVIAKIAKRKATELQLVIGQLTTITLFFAMRSYASICKFPSQRNTEQK